MTGGVKVVYVLGVRYYFVENSDSIKLEISCREIGPLGISGNKRSQHQDKTRRFKKTGEPSK
jgi:hypothetical protein